MAGSSVNSRPPAGLTATVRSVCIGGRIVDAELPANAGARSILSVIGAGERTNAGLSTRTGVKSNNLTAPTGPLTVLTAKRIIASALPLSTRPSGERRY